MDNRQLIERRLLFIANGGMYTWPDLAALLREAAAALERAEQGPPRDCQHEWTDARFRQAVYKAYGPHTDDAELKDILHNDPEYHRAVAALAEGKAPQETTNG